MRSIKTRIILVTVGLILLVVVVLTGVIATNASKTMHETLENELDQRARQASNLFLNFLKWQATNLEAWNNQPIVKVFFKSPALAVMSRSGLQTYLRKACENAPWIADILLLDNDAVLYDHTYPSVQVSQESGQWKAFLDLLHGRQPFLFNLGQLRKGQDRWVLVLSQAFTDESKVLEGKIIAIFLDLAKVNRELFADLTVGRKGFITLTGLLPDGRVVLVETVAQTDTQREFFNTAKGWEKPGDIPESHKTIGTIMLASARLPNFPIQIVGVASKDEFQKPVQGLITNSLIIGLFILAFGILGAVVFSRKITAPITRLTAVVKDVTSGGKKADDSQEFGELMARTDELGVLSSAFNAMLAEIRLYTAELEERVALRTKDLADSQQHLTQIIDYLPDPTFVIDGNGMVTAWNRAMQELTGVKAEEMLAKGDHAYAIPFHGEKKQMLIDLVRLKAWDETHEDLYLSITKKQDGSVISESFRPELRGGIYLSATARELIDATGQSAGAIECIRDITPQREAENALREAEERIRLVLKSAGEGIFGIDAEGRITFVNPAAARMLGYEEDELVGQASHDLIHSAHEDGTPYPIDQCPMHATYTSGSAKVVEGEVFWRRDGGCFPVEYFSKPIDKAGKIIGAVVTFRDVTERKRSERAIRDKQHQLQTIVDNLPSVVVLKDLAGVHLLANAYYEQIRGVAPAEVLGKTDAEVLPPELAKAIMAVDREVMDSGQARNYEEQVLLPDGTLHDYLTTKVPLFDDTGEVYGIVGLATDITERKRIEMQIEATRKELQLIFDSSQVGIMFMHGDCDLARANRRLAEILGYGNPKEMVGLNMRNLHLTDAAFQAFKAKHQEVMKRGEQTQNECQLKMRNGTAVWCSMTGKAVDEVQPPDLSKGVIWVIDDITEKKRVQSLLVEGQQRLDMALAASNTGMWDWYPLEGKSYRNDQWYRQLGYTRDEFDEASDVLMALMHPEDTERFKANIAVFEKEKQDDYQQEFRMKAKDGSWKWILFLGRVQERDNAGRSSRIVGVHLDMTERKNAEEEVKANLEELERFSRVVVNREEKMIQLKEEINVLLSQMGKGEKYKIVE